MAAILEPALDFPPPVAAPSASARGRILIYCSALMMLVGFGAPFNGLIDVPVSFFLKNKLHLNANQLAGFRLWTAIPLYLSFLFGFARDRWNALGLGDRGIMILFGAVTAALYVAFAYLPISAASLLIGLLILTSAHLFVMGAQNGLFARLGQRHAMSGQISAAWSTFLAVPVIAAFLIGGYLSDQLEGQKAEQAARILFLTGAAVMASICVYALAKPRSVYDQLILERPPRRPMLGDLARLVRHWPIYPALLIWLLVQFSPGSQTVLQYYMSDTLHATDAQWGAYNSIFYASLIPAFLLFGVLCRRWPLRRLLWIGTVLTVPQMIPLIFVHSPTDALIVAVPIGLMGGMAVAAYLDLIIRSCPPGLEAAVLMMSNGLFFVSTRFGDLWGTSLYQHPGRLTELIHWRGIDPRFAICGIATTAVYALILPVLPFIPSRLTAARDGEAPPPIGA